MKLEIKNKDKIISMIQKKIAEINSLCKVVKENDLSVKIQVERNTLQGDTGRKITERLDITPSATLRLLTVNYHGEIYNYYNRHNMKTKTEYKKVKGFNHLKELCQDKECEMFISLNNGLRSSKTITLDNGSWSILHEIDWNKNEYTNDADFKKQESFFMEALDKGAVYLY